MDAKTAGPVSLDDIWTPESPLPTRPVLRKLAARCGRQWNAVDLMQQTRLVYNPRLRTTLGRAILQDMRVELNPHLLNANPAELIPTLAHELAHLVVFRRHGRAQPHGPEFRRLMQQLGLSGRATHDLNVEHVRRRRGKYLYLHRCSDCGGHFVARRVRRNCYCRACGPDMTWDIFRVPNSAAGRRLLQQLQA